MELYVYSHHTPLWCEQGYFSLMESGKHSFIPTNGSVLLVCYQCVDVIWNGCLFDPILPTLTMFWCVSKITKSDYWLHHVSLSVPLNVRVEIGSHEMDFYEIWYLSTFQKSVDKIQVLLKSDNNNGCLCEDLCRFLITSRSFPRGMRNISDKS